MAEPSKLEPAKTLFVTCFPKSGSTYVTRLLAAITNSTVIGMSDQVGGQNEQDLHQPAVQAALGKTSVTHQHAKGTHNNVALMRLYGIRPVILVRNIFDVVVSLLDHIEHESPLTPTGYIIRAYPSMTRVERIDFLVHFHLPWYFNFYCSWLEHADEVGAMWLTYEQFFADPFQAARQLAEFYALNISDRGLRDAIAGMTNEFTRFNVGVTGRGASLPRRCRKKIQEMARSSGIAPCDLSRVGIEPRPALRSGFRLLARGRQVNCARGTCPIQSQR
jgi:hypothetical protein